MRNISKEESTKLDLLKEKAKHEILQVAAKQVRPLLIGPFSVSFSWPLQWVEAVFDDLQADRKLRRATERECKAFDVMEGYFAYDR